jgi:hypothetical protein
MDSNPTETSQIKFSTEEATILQYQQCLKKSSLQHHAKIQEMLYMPCTVDKASEDDHHNKSSKP